MSPVNLLPIFPVHTAATDTEESPLDFANFDTERGTDFINAVERHRSLDRCGNWPAVVASEEPEVIGLQRAASQLQRIAKLATPCRCPPPTSSARSRPHRTEQCGFLPHAGPQLRTGDDPTAVQ